MADSASMLRTMLADVSAFQTWVGADDADGALPSIYLHTAPSDADHPYAVVTDSDDGSTNEWTLLAGGSRNYLQESGRLTLMLEDSLDSIVRDDSGEPLVDDSLIGQFRDDVQSIIDGLAVLAAVGGYLAVHTITRRQSPTVADSADESLIIFAMYDVAWGMQG